VTSRAIKSDSGPRHSCDDVSRASFSSEVKVVFDRAILVLRENSPISERDYYAFIERILIGAELPGYLGCLLEQTNRFCGANTATIYINHRIMRNQFWDLFAQSLEDSDVFFSQNKTRYGTDVLVPTL
jgi:hypothetical protein